MANTKTTDESASLALDGSELIRGVQSGSNVKITANQMRTFTSTSAVTFANLPASPTNGALFTITDATVTNPGSIVSSGGGTDNVLAYYDSVAGDWVTFSTPPAFTGRLILTADANFYVSPTGSDTTGDGSIGNPWRHPETWYLHTINSLDLGGFNSICNFHSPGTYSGFSTLVGPVGDGYLVMLGDNTDPTQVVFTSRLSLESEGGRMFISGVTLDGASWALSADSGMAILLGEPTFTVATKINVKNKIVGNEILDDLLGSPGLTLQAMTVVFGGVFMTTASKFTNTIIFPFNWEVQGNITAPYWYSIIPTGGGDWQTVGIPTFTGGSTFTGVKYRLGDRAILNIDGTLADLPGTLPDNQFSEGVVFTSLSYGVSYNSASAAGDPRETLTTNTVLPAFIAPATANCIYRRNNTQFDNTGAVGTVIITLPTIIANAIGTKFGFCVIASQILEVLAPASTTISLGSLTSAAAGNVQSNIPLSYLELEAVSTTKWVAKAVTGTWTLT